MPAAGSDDGIVGQFLMIKRETDADVLALQCGDFYEFFDEDAELVARELDLTVSRKGSGDTSCPMAGVPLSELTPYLKALVERGYRVAVADQYETDSGYGREITRVATPGTLLETTAEDAQYLAALVRAGASPDGDNTGNSRSERDGGEDAEDGIYGLAFADVTTGRFHATTAEGRGAVRTELHRFVPAELLAGPGSEAVLDAVGDRLDATVTECDEDAFAPGRARHRVREQFGAETPASVGLDEPATRAAGAILAYVEETGTGVLASMTRLQTYGADAEGVALDATTQRNLELTETIHGSREESLSGTIDHTATSAGGRLLREWLTRPRRSIEKLRRRHTCVGAFCEGALVREEVRDCLSEAYDLERLASRAVSGSAGPSELLRVRETLALVPALVAAIEASSLAESPIADVLGRVDRDAVEEVREELAAALADDPPKSLIGGGLIERGYDETLDEMIDEHEGALEWVRTLEAREKRRNSITHLRVDRNKTDGYYIQVGKSESENVPAAYEEIKTLKNARRYMTPELDEREREILRYEQRRGELERELFEGVREAVAADAETLQDVGRALAELDCLASLATHAVRHDWTRPAFGASGIDIEAGRHPVVEHTTEFVPNDARLDEERSLVLVTGPNMSGKSTYMRQTALITLLAQIGSFVPARSATIEPVDGIFTRVGALDELAQGRSTFMVEMAELSNILHSATDDSLVILDEVGRGTATFDGISIAWAATEYLVNEIKSKTLFATHYHELTELAERLPGVHNVHMTADERDGEVTFLRAVEEGPADRSYGVHVADLAGVPSPVVSRSRDVLQKLREDRAVDVRGGSDGTQQVVFDLGTGSFRASAEADGGRAADGTDAAAGNGNEGGGAGSSGTTSGEDADRNDPATEAVLEELRDTDLDGTAPIELLSKVQSWQQRLDES